MNPALARGWRIAWAIGAAGVALALALEGYLTAVEVAAWASVAAAVWRYLAFFTVLTSVLVIAVLAHAVVRPKIRAGLGSPRIELLAATSIIIVGAIYNALLASQWHVAGWRRFDEVVLHGVSPVLFVLLYWLLRPRGGLGLRAALTTLLWPLAYAIYVFLRGALDGFHPYFFLDPTRTPWPRIVVHLAALLLAFVLLAWLLARVDRLLCDCRASRQEPDGSCGPIC